MHVNQVRNTGGYSINNKKQQSFKHYLSQNAVNDVRRIYASSPHLPKYLESIKSYNAFMRGLDKVSYNQLTDQLFQKYGITTDLQNNKVLAGMNVLACNIFQKLGMVKPPSLLIRNFKKAPQNYHGAGAVTVTHTAPSDFDLAFNERYPFRSVIFNSDVNWDDIQLITIHNKEIGKLSSGHFLSIPLHEYYHNAHVDNLFKRFGVVDGERNFTVMQNSGYGNKKMADFVQRETSTYAVEGGPLETFAEEMTERTVDSLDPNTIMPRINPFAPSSTYGEPASLNKLIDDIWNGTYY